MALGLWSSARPMRFPTVLVFCAVACSPGPGDGGTGGGSTNTGGGGASSGGGSGGGAGTGGSGQGGGIRDAGVSCDGGETFTAAQAAMLSTCSGGGVSNCHSISPYDGTLDLTPAHAYAQLFQVPASVNPDKLRVVPGDPLGSFLTQKLTDTMAPTEGGPMPQGEGIMWRAPDPESLRVLECWIQQGANNN
jgi:hypothetical protein